MDTEDVPQYNTSKVSGASKQEQSADARKREPCGMKSRTVIAIAALLLVSVVVVLIARNHSHPGDVSQTTMERMRPERIDLSSYDSAPPRTPLRLLFIHHSCGGQLLAPPGPERGTNAIYLSSPNGGGLRALLEQNRYTVHEASYGSRIGQNTDIFDWPAKFREQMDQILRCDLQDTAYSDGARNQIVLFKSCFPNSAFKAQGAAPGNPAGPELTVANAKAAYNALLPEFRKHPEILFVCLTAPPLAPNPPRQALWKRAAKKILGRDLQYPESGVLAREFNDWLASTDGWLKDSTLKNVVVFDLYDLLTAEGRSDFSCYATGNGFDSHPSQEGNLKAAQALVPFLNQAVRRTGLSP